MKGIAISAEKIKETFTGEGAQAGGTPQAKGLEMFLVICRRKRRER